MVSWFHKSELYRIITFSISVLYSCALIYMIPMGDLIKDRANYLIYASDSDFFAFKYLSKGVVVFFSNEPVWLGVNVALNSFFYPEQVVFFIIFFSAFVSSYIILKSNPKNFLFLIFILFFPQVIGKYIVHIRQGFGIAIFLLGWFSISKYWRWFLFLLTPFIHASFFFVILLLAYTSALKKMKFAQDLRVYFVVGLGVITGLSIGGLARVVGARQTGLYDFVAAETSGVGFLFWMGILILYCLQGRSFANKNSFAFSAITFYLSTYFLIEVTGRIFESSLIIVLLASLGLTDWRRKMFLVMISAFALFSFVLRLDQPWFGWGVGAVV